MMPKVTFHIGMGKTGTSSIQSALGGNEESLATTGARYLGMGFDALGAPYEGPSGVESLADTAPEELVVLAERYAKAVDGLATESVGHFLVSNERFFQYIDRLHPFFTALAEHVDLRFIAFLRNPRTWLPSAHSQWGIDHKGYPGPVQSFGERSRTLIRWYDCIKPWTEHFGPILDVREHQSGIDIVADFADAAGVALANPQPRVQERRDKAELLLRAAYNDRIPGGARPGEFDRAVLPAKIRPIGTRADLARRCFDLSERDAVLAENEPIFTYIRDTYGFDFVSKPSDPTTDNDASGNVPLPGIDLDALDDRLVDYLLAITVSQARRLQRLESELHRLTKAVAAEAESDR